MGPGRGSGGPGDVDATSPSDVSASPDTAPLTADRRARLPPVAELGRGAAVGRYLVIARVGAGTSGVVYRAYDPELDRAVAIKLVRAEPGRRERVLREAQALAQLSHPNVIAVHDVGTLGDQVFVTMEYVEGETLRAWLKSPRSIARILDVFLAAGRGLQAAHDVGLIHRDFKPENVLVGTDERVRVVDFGLARSANLPEELAPPPDVDLEIDTARFLKTSLTRTGTLLGTPRYMAPEQHLRRAADARSDQFSFCIALYEALYGERPFAGDTLAELAVAVTGGQLRAEPAGRKVPASLRRIVLRGLENEPALRYPDMAAILAELQAYAAPRRRRRIAAVAGALLVPLVVVGALVPQTRDAAPACPTGASYLERVWDPAVREQVRVAFARSHKPYAADTYQRIVGHLDAYAARWTAMRTQVCAQSRDGHAADPLGEVRVTCLNRRLRALEATADQLARADDELIDHAVDAALRLPPVDECDDARLVARGALLPHAPAARDQIAELGRRLEQVRAMIAAGRFEPARAAATALLTAAAAQPYVPLRAEVHYELGLIEDHFDAWAEARVHHEQAARLAAEVGDDGLAALALLAVQRADFGLERLAGNSGDRALAADVFVEAAFARLGRGDPRYADYLLSAGQLRLWLERPDAALPFLERARQLKETQYGPADVRVAEVLVELASSLPPQREPEQLALLDRALGIYRERLGAKHPAVGETLNRIGLVSSDADQRVAAYDQGVAIFAASFGETDWTVGRALNNSGEVLCLRGDTTRGLERLGRGLAIYEQAFGPGHCHLGYPLDSIGTCHLRDHPAQAIAPLERALAACAGTSLHPALVLEMKFHLARALWESGGDRARALALAREARGGHALTAGRSRKELDEIDAWLAMAAQTTDAHRLAGR